MNIRLKDKVYNPINDPLTDNLNTKVSDIYANKTQEENQTKESKIDLNSTNPYNPYSKLSGLNPINNTFQTETKNFNKEIDSINKDIYSKEDFYKNVLAQNKLEVNKQKAVQKTDHIKKIFSALNFPTKPSSYNEAFDYNYEKKKVTIDHEYDNHYKKSFMKTYEEIKHMNKIILRK